MQNSVAKKFFAVGSAVAMTLSLAVPFVASAAVHADGTNVNKSGTVGMIIGGQFRPPLPPVLSCPMGSTPGPVL